MESLKQKKNMKKCSLHDISSTTPAQPHIHIPTILDVLHSLCIYIIVILIVVIFWQSNYRTHTWQYHIRDSICNSRYNMYIHVLYNYTFGHLSLVHFFLYWIWFVYKQIHKTVEYTESFFTDGFDVLTHAMWCLTLCHNCQN